MRTLWIAVAGAFGAVARSELSGWIARSRVGVFPWGTFTVNVLGSFAVGFIFALTTERFMSSPTLRIAVTVGFLGAFTTFSTFSLETMRLAEGGAIGLAALNVVASVGAGLAAIYAGTWAGRTL